MNLLWESIRMGVCRKCIDGDNRGNCRLPSDELCPLETYFPAISEIVSTRKHESLDSTMHLLRERVCEQCLYGSTDQCRRRETLECAVERYLPLIMERIGSMQIMAD